MSTVHLEAFKPATDKLLDSLAQGINERTSHEHPNRSPNLFCLNLAAFAGERIGPVLRRLHDAEAERDEARAEVERLRAEVAANEVSR